MDTVSNQLLMIYCYVCRVWHFFNPNQRSLSLQRLSTGKVAREQKTSECSPLEGHHAYPSHLLPSLRAEVAWDRKAVRARDRDDYKKMSSSEDSRAVTYMTSRQL